MVTKCTTASTNNMKSWCNTCTKEKCGWLFDNKVKTIETIGWWEQQGMEIGHSLSKNTSNSKKELYDLFYVLYCPYYIGDKRE